jgi:hypothetical protein
MVSLMALMALVCAHPAQTADSATTRPVAALKPIASIQDLMQGQIEPAATVLWESVSTITSATGTEEQQPQTDEEWHALRRHALTLIEAANLVLMEGRQVVRKGAEVEDAHIAGVLPAARIQQAITADRAEFIEHAHALRAAGVQALAAIDARNPEHLLKAGGHIESACEACHQKYWYPDEKLPWDRKR